MSIIQPIGTINRKLSKADITKLADQHASEIIESGKFDLLKTYVEIKRYELYFKTIIYSLRRFSTQQAQSLRATATPIVSPVARSLSQ